MRLAFAFFLALLLCVFMVVRGTDAVPAARSDDARAPASGTNDAASKPVPQR